MPFDVPEALRRRVLEAVAWIDAARILAEEADDGDQLANANLAAALAEGRAAKAQLEEWTA